MPMEQETMGLLIDGFAIVVGVMVFVTVFLWTKNKNNNIAYVSFLSHFILLSVAVYIFTKAIPFNSGHPMASEEVSLRIGVSGLVWAMSMFCLLIGLIKLSSRKKTYT